MKSKKLTKGLDYNDLEKLLTGIIKSYEDGWNEANKEESKIRFNLTVSKIKVPIEGRKKDVAYIRLERQRMDIKDDKVIENYLLYSNAYKFKNKAEILQPEKWRRSLYLNLLSSLLLGGIEHAELIHVVKKANHRDEKKKEVIMPNEEAIQIATEMPSPLTAKEKEYKEWAEKNNENAVVKKS